MNKNKIGIVVDSTFKLSKSFLSQHQIEVAYLDIIVDDKTFKDGEITNDELFNQMMQNKKVSTSQPTPSRFVEAFEAQFKKGFEHVICLTISAGLSGTYNSANLAKTMTTSPEKVTVIDTKTTICGSEYLTEQLVLLCDQKDSIKSVIDAFHFKRDKGSLIFTVDDLNILVKGGRLSRLQGMIGNLLKIKPILRFDQGKLDVEHKVRSNDNVIKYIVNEVQKLSVKAKTVVRISFTTANDMGHMLEKEILSKFNNVSVSFSGIISAVVAVHVGKAGLGIYLTTE
ncbi:MAG TPA: DegV family protein [Acholeplasma sp.]|nr:DegV family protein [Acholeplasma sp.]